MTATSIGDGLSASISITVVVRDKNDRPPEFDEVSGNHGRLHRIINLT